MRTPLGFIIVINVPRRGPTPNPNNGREYFSRPLPSAHAVKETWLHIAGVCRTTSR